MEISARVATWIDTVVPNIRSRSIAQSSEFNSRPGIVSLQLPNTLVRYRMVGDGPQTLVLAADPPVVIEQYDRRFNSEVQQRCIDDMVEHRGRGKGRGQGRKSPAAMRA